MATQAVSISTAAQLMHMGEGLVLHQALYAAAKLGIADLLASGPRSSIELASDLQVNEEALFRLLRFLAGQGVFEQSATRVFGQSELSHYLRSDVPGSLRGLFVFKGSSYYFPPFQEIIYSVQTGRPGRERVCGMEGFEYLRQNPELACTFDDAMTSVSSLMAPAIATAYDFGAWGSLMDVGGGNGILLSEILKGHPKLRGVLADQPHVLDRARERGFLGGALAARASFVDCDFFREVPPGCRAYLMKSVIHDWDDERSTQILRNCRRAIEEHGVLLLVEYVLPDNNSPSTGRTTDLMMLVLTGGKERTVVEYQQLLANGGFRITEVFPTAAEIAIIEAKPI